MSRIGNKSITFEPSVTISLEAGVVTVKGAKGQLSCAMPKHISLKIEDNKITLHRESDTIINKTNHGLVRSLINNMVVGVTTGFSRKLELVGTGYRAKLQGNKLILSLGFSRPVEIVPPQGINIVTESDTVVVVSGIDKQLVGQVAANIRAKRPPEPYKGKGVRYQGELIRRKAGKAAKSG